MMQKEDFLNQLREALAMDLPAQSLTEHLLYYEDYITKEIADGKAESAVLRSLGDPRLIARAILDTLSDDRSAEDTRESYENHTTHSHARREGFQQKHGSRPRRRSSGWPIPFWIILIIVLLIFFLMLRTLLSLFFLETPLFLLIILFVFIIRHMRRGWR